MVLSVDYWSTGSGRWARGPTLMSGESCWIADNRSDGRYEVVISCLGEDGTITERLAPLDGAPGAGSDVRVLAKGQSMEMEWRGDLHPDVIRKLRVRHDVVIGIPNQQARQ